MVDRKGKKRTLISIASSSEEEEDEQSEEESEESDDNDEEYEEDGDETCASTSCGDDDDDDDGDASEWSDDKGDESDNQKDDESSDLDDKDSLCDRVIRLLQGRGDLQELNLKDCKAYLQKHGLRTTGTKAECVQRIKEHWRIKDGNGEALYPRSSFTINCTGDACRGDVVLFTQKVYEKFDKMTRKGNLQGKRTIAGRIVKESYGAAKQQHTFTVEVLWSKGIRKLPPLFSLLVKGRNLYKLKTFRQVWKNEAERSKVLAEKHKRGAAARHKRAMKKTWSTNGGAKRQKHIHHERPSQMRRATKRQRAKRVDGQKASKRPAKSNSRQKASSIGQVNMKKSTRVPNSYGTHQNLTHPIMNRDPTFQSNAYPPQNYLQSHFKFHHQGAPLGFPSYEVGSTSSRMRLPHFRPYAGAYTMPASQHLGFNDECLHTTYTQPSYEHEPRNINHLQRPMNIYHSQNAFSMRRETYGQWNNRF
ncbi:hypothetical protein F0562_006560 [Nyssa sinensis]|uniref:SAP domain-containing protein n=1 Tax=Nyssa sinensis TaxID=561372 RepID=A0A5J5AL70_9ASTE|nr:hypothetical protein F0562_006560 [Nyssa sinensis]